MKLSQTYGKLFKKYERIVKFPESSERFMVLQIFVKVHEAFAKFLFKKSIDRFSKKNLPNVFEASKVYLNSVFEKLHGVYINF